MPRRVLVLGLAVVAAGCGASTARQSEANPVAFAQCVRAHGFPTYPDPRPGGGFTIPLADARSPLFKAAIHSCDGLLPKAPVGVTPAQHAAWRAHGAAYARCMRAHGVPGFPDPESNGVIDLAAHRNVLETPGLQQAEAACRNLGAGSAVVYPGR